MGTMTFHLPAGLTEETVRDLERACITGGPDNMPSPTEVEFEGLSGRNHMKGSQGPPQGQPCPLEKGFQGPPDPLEDLGPLETSFRMILRRAANESGYLVTPWDLEELGRFMGTSSTLMERARPYDLVLELARGKVQQVRNQLAEWRASGLHIDTETEALVQNMVSRFARAATSRALNSTLSDPRATKVSGSPFKGTLGRQRENSHGEPDAYSDSTTQAQAGVSPEAAPGDLARRALLDSYQVAEHLVRAYQEQVFRIRHQRRPRLDTSLVCRLADTLDPSTLELQGKAGHQISTNPLDCQKAFSTLALPISWHVVEAQEASYNWAPVDALLDWAEKAGFEVVAGPLVDFSSSQLPAWLWAWESDPASLATFMCRFVETAVRRYRGRIRKWQITAASNWAQVLSLPEDHLLDLTYRLSESAHQVDPSLELSVGIAQPWGEYMVAPTASYLNKSPGFSGKSSLPRQSPFIFADTLIRSDLNLAALDVELLMGVHHRGSYCRDLLETSRMLNLYALLGVPLRVTLGYPSASKPDPACDPELHVGAGRWRSGYSPEMQAEWAQAFTSLALCKPFVQAITWAQWTDAGPHCYPHCGLHDHEGQPKPALEALRMLREQHMGPSEGRP